MIDPAIVGTTFPPFQYAVERSKIRELAAALGDPNPIYRDVEAARAAGYPDLPAPPTLPTLFSFWAEPPLLSRLETLGVDLPRVLHGEEEYEYRRPVYAGDTITGTMTVTNVRARRGMEFLSLETTYVNQHGETVVIARTLMIVRAVA